MFARVNEHEQGGSARQQPEQTPSDGDQLGQPAEHTANEQWRPDHCRDNGLTK
jgi:hypothetical protein